MNCELTTPVNLGSEEWPDFEFSFVECEVATTTEIYELVVNPEYPGRQFFLDKTFSYGDFLIIFFFVLILLWTIGEKIFKFFWR